MQMTEQVCIRCADYMGMRLKSSGRGGTTAGRTPDLLDRPLQDISNIPSLFPTHSLHSVPEAHLAC